MTAVYPILKHNGDMLETSTFWHQSPYCDRHKVWERVRDRKQAMILVLFRMVTHQRELRLDVLVLP